MKKFWDTAGIAVRWVVTIALLALIFSRIDGARFRQVFEKINPGMFAAAVIWCFAANPLDVVICRRILGRLGIRLSFLEVFRVNYWAYFFSFLGGIPGGLSRMIGFSGPEKKTGEAFAAILVERYFKLWATCSFFLLGFYCQPGSRFTRFERNIFLSAGVCLWLFLLLILGFFFCSRGLSALGLKNADAGAPASAGGFFKRHWFRLRVVIGSLPAVRRDWLFLFSAYSLQALLTMGAFWLVTQAVGVSFGFLDVLWIVSFVALVEVVPLTVFGLGIREGVLIYLLSRYGMIAEKGLALGFLWFLIGVLMGVAGGIWFLLGAGRRSAKSA